MLRFSSQLRERCEETQRRAVTMLIFLLMPFLVCAEWVEISQNHYRKEPHRSVIHLSESKTSKYKNDSITEYQWSKGYVDKVPSIGNVQQRIHKVERRPSVIIEKTPIHHEDSMIMDETKHRFNNEMKSSNRVPTFQRHEDRNEVSHIQRTQHPTIKGDYRINDRDMPKIQSVLNKNIEANSFEKDIRHEKDKHFNSDKFTSTVTLGTADLRIEGLSDKPAVDFTEKNKVDFQEVTTEKYLQNNKEEILNSKLKQESHKPHDEKMNKTKNNGFDTLIKFLKVVSQTIQRSTRRSFNGKVRYLEDLKDTLLASIEARIESEFPDDSVKQRRRRSETESRGHVEFPSSESALMTISFLTFAVFLIKLVLQVIHTYKAKTMMVTPAVVATVGRSRILRNP